MVRIARGENLCLGFQTAKSAGMDDAIAVARVGTTVRVGRFNRAPAAGLLRAHRPGSRRGNWFDGPLRHISADPRECLGVERIRLSAKENPARDRVDPQEGGPGSPSLSRGGSV